ncbi:hypothetical protein EON63_08005 [archaeon]|nr:MAG: hypothetical protein EON63_08005 [archaeon]
MHMHIQIERDIDRTFPRHFLFQDGGQGQGALRNVLRRYAALDREVWNNIHIPCTIHHTSYTILCRWAIARVWVF